MLWLLICAFALALLGCGDGSVNSDAFYDDKNSEIYEECDEENRTPLNDGELHFGGYKKNALVPFVDSKGRQFNFKVNINSIYWDGLAGNCALWEKHKMQLVSEKPSMTIDIQLGERQLQSLGMISVDRVNYVIQTNRAEGGDTLTLENSGITYRHVYKLGKGPYVYFSFQKGILKYEGENGLTVMLDEDPSTVEPEEVPGDSSAVDSANPPPDDEKFTEKDDSDDGLSLEDLWDEVKKYL